MRKLGMLLACGALLLMSVAWVEGQQEKKQPGGGGGGFGGFGGFGGYQNPYSSTFLRGDVKKELDVTDEQMEKLPDEMLVAISKVLTDKQFKRFKQIDLQNRKNLAFKDPKVQKDLKITDEQKKNIAAILADETKELADLAPKFGGGGGGKGGKGGGFDFKGNQEKQEAVRKDAREKIYTVLTKDQRKNWREMIGEEFTFSQGGFGGGFGFGGKGKDAKDAKDAKKDSPKDK